MNQFRKEMFRFIIAGASAVSIDLVSYYFLQFLIVTNIAKGISFILGTVVAYFINKYWTFEKSKKSYSQILKFGILYLFSLSVNVLINHMVLDILNHVLIAFIIATGASTILNFIGQKWWVFR